MVVGATATTVSVRLAEAVWTGEPESVTRNVSGVLETRVDVLPEMTPAVLKVKPVGREPEVSVQVLAPVPPVEASVCEYATPWLPFGKEAVVTASRPTTLAVAVTAGMFVPLAVMREDPAATPVIGTVTVVAVARIVTVAGTVAAPGVPEVRLITTPPTGAGEESVSVRFCVAVPIMLTVGALNAMVAFTFTVPEPASNPGPLALMVVEPRFTPERVG